MKQLVKRCLRACGYTIQRVAVPTAAASDLPSRLYYDEEDEAREAILRVRGYTMIPYPRQVTLWQQAVHCEKHRIPGAFVECGTWRGGAVGLMALANLKFGAERRPLHLFDSFQGCPEPDEKVDGERAIREAQAIGSGTEGRLVVMPDYYMKAVGLNGPLEDNRDLLENQLGYDPKFVHYHAGWFQDIVPVDAKLIGPIAILRLDGDYYASTRVCLEHLFDRVVEGGFVIIDDYGAYEGCRRAVDKFRLVRGIKDFMTCIDSEGRYWVNSSHHFVMKTDRTIPLCDS